MSEDELTQYNPDLIFTMSMNDMLNQLHLLVDSSREHAALTGQTELSSRLIKQLAGVSAIMVQMLQDDIPAHRPFAECPALHDNVVQLFKDRQTEVLRFALTRVEAMSPDGAA